MIHAFERREKELYIEITKAIFDTILKETVFNVTPYYATGGACRRLHLIEKERITKKDLMGLFRSDFDFHASSLDTKVMYHQVPSKLWVEPVLSDKVTPYDNYGIGEFRLGSRMAVKNVIVSRPSHILEDLAPLIAELKPYREALAAELGVKDYDIDKEMKDIVIQFINNRAISLNDFLNGKYDMNTLTLGYDLYSSCFAYRDGTLYDCRPAYCEENDHYDIINFEHASNSPLKTFIRLRKMEELGYLYSEENLKAFIDHLFTKVYNEVIEQNARGKLSFGLEHRSRIFSIDDNYGADSSSKFKDGIINDPEIISTKYDFVRINTLLDKVDAALKTPLSAEDASNAVTLYKVATYCKTLDRTKFFELFGDEHEFHFRDFYYDERDGIEKRHHGFIVANTDLVYDILSHSYIRYYEHAMYDNTDPYFAILHKTNDRSGMESHFQSIKDFIDESLILDRLYIINETEGTIVTGAAIAEKYSDMYVEETLKEIRNVYGSKFIKRYLLKMHEELHGKAD